MVNKFNKIALVKITYTNYSENECIYEGQEQQLKELLNREDVVSFEFLRGEDFINNSEIKVQIEGTVNIREHNEYFNEYKFTQKTFTEDFMYNKITKKYTWLGDSCESNLNTRPQKLKEDSISQFLMVGNYRKFRID